MFDSYDKFLAILAWGIMKHPEFYDRSAYNELCVRQYNDKNRKSRYLRGRLIRSLHKRQWRQNWWRKNNADEQGRRPRGVCWNKIFNDPETGELLTMEGAFRMLCNESEVVTQLELRRKPPDWLRKDNLAKFR